MATQLLQLALTLLIAAQGANVSPELRAQAISVATTAITFSQQQIASEAVVNAPKQAPNVIMCTGGYDPENCVQPVKTPLEIIADYQKFSPPRYKVVVEDKEYGGCTHVYALTRSGYVDTSNVIYNYCP